MQYTKFQNLYLGVILIIGISCQPNKIEQLPQVTFATAEISKALNGDDADIKFEIQPDSTTSEAFSIIVSEDGAIKIVGSDAAGAMYGGLEVSELIRIGGIQNVKPVSQEPYMGMRGIKFNIPLDVRTPSYSDMGDAGQYNIENVWDFEFWKQFIDEASTHRFNYISLWNLHPFPSLVKVPEYPDIALDDVKKAVGLEKKFYHGRGEDFDAPDILDRTETIINISIDEKIDFWKSVMRYGKSRNVDFYFVTWNIFDYGTEGKYGIDDNIKNEVTRDYFRKSVREMFLTYPDLKGIGLTAGENMHGATNEEKEDWAFATYGQGVLDAVEVQPGREITFLHRQHQAGAGAIAEVFKPLIDHPNIDFIFSYKYAKAHAYSSTKQPFYREFAQEIQGRSDNLKTIWTMRNDSHYLFRIALTDFMREYVQNIPMELTRGYYFGSDGMIWGKEFMHKDPEGSSSLEIQSHWFEWMLWGRLAYDPGISNQRFVEILQTYYPEVDARQLLSIWEKSCMVYPLVTGFHWGPLDYLWYPEACIGFPKFTGTETGFHDVNRFITLGSHPGEDYIKIPDYVTTILEGQSPEGTTPFEVAAELIDNANEALAGLQELEASENKELGETLKDIEAMALLSRYYGYKIIGAVNLHFYRETNDKTYQSKSVEALQNAAAVWRDYVANIDSRFIQPMWLARIRTDPVVFSAITEWVDNDITIAETDAGKK